MSDHIEKIVRACQGPGGIRSIFLTPEDNFTGSIPIGPNTNEIIWADPERVVGIGFRKRNARYRKRSESSVFGTSEGNTLEFSILRGRIEVEDFISTWVGRRLHAYFVQNSGLARYQWSAKLSYTYDTNLALNEADEYIFRLNGTSTYGSGAYAGKLTIDPGAGEESSSPDPEEDCYPKVNHTPLSYIPDPTGNQHNRNEIVTAVDGTIWFIDKEGRALRFTKTAGDIEITNPQKGLIIASPFFAKWRTRVNNQGDIFTQNV